MIIDIPEFVCVGYEQKGLSDLSYLVGQVHNLWEWMRLTGTLQYALNNEVYSKSVKQKLTIIENRSGVHLMKLDDSQQTFDM